MKPLLRRRLRWLRRHWLLSLVPKLEAQFQRERRETYVPSILVSVTTAFLLLSLYLAADFLTLRQFWRWQFLLPVALLAALPALIAVIALLRRKTPGFPLWWVALPAASNSLCWAVLPSVGNVLGVVWPYEIMLYNFLYTFFFLAIPLRVALVSALGMAFTYLLLQWYSAARDWTLFTHCFVLFGFVVHGAAASAIFERNERRDWLSRRRLTELSRRDSLTGLINRRTFFEKAELALRQARRSKATVALALIDADHFKRFNDTYGHGAGDHCLQQLAGRFALATQRPLDCAARIGGEEFALLFFDAPERWAITRAQQLCDAVHALHQDDRPCTTISIGLAISDGHASVASLLQRADAGLYRAKAAGRNCVAT